MLDVCRCVVLLLSSFSWSGTLTVRESSGMNPDQLKAGERCASTSNRNFEGDLRVLALNALNWTVQ